MSTRSSLICRSCVAVRSIAVDCVTVDSIGRGGSVLAWGCSMIGRRTSCCRVSIGQSIIIFEALILFSSFVQSSSRAWRRRSYFIFSWLFSRLRRSRRVLMSAIYLWSTMDSIFVIARVTSVSIEVVAVHVEVVDDLVFWERRWGADCCVGSST
jgi:hypothetical protein